MIVIVLLYASTFCCWFSCIVMTLTQKPRVYWHDKIKVFHCHFFDFLLHIVLSDGEFYLESSAHFTLHLGSSSFLPRFVSSLQALPFTFPTPLLLRLNILMPFQFYTSCRCLNNPVRTCKTIINQRLSIDLNYRQILQHFHYQTVCYVQSTTD